MILCRLCTFYIFSLAFTIGFENKITTAIPVEDKEIFSYLEKKIHLSLIDSLIRIKIYKKKMQYASNKELGVMNVQVIRIIGIP